METQESNQKYLKRCKVTHNDPGIVFDWNDDTLAMFIEGANSNIGLSQAYFITTSPGTMTVASLLNDLMHNLSRVAGGRNGNTLLAPNTLSQSYNIIEIIKEVESDDWVQQLFAEFVPVGYFFATVYYIVDRRDIKGIPIGLVPPQNPAIRQVFK